MSSRLLKSLTALSQLAQVSLLRRHADSSPNETISGRCYWESVHGRYAGHWSWRLGRRAIDALLWFDRDENGRRHCELADEREYLDCREKVRRYEGRDQ